MARAGLQAIKRCGGFTVVQNPEDAVAAGMPLSALRNVLIDHCVRLSEMPSLLSRLIRKPSADKFPEACRETKANAIATTMAMTPKEMENVLGPPSSFVCPECNGPIWEVKDGKLTQFRCLVGHIFSPESFLAQEAEALESSLWVAVRTLEERTSLLRRLAKRSLEMDQAITRSSFLQKAEENEKHAAVIRDILKSFEEEKRV